MLFRKAAACAASAAAWCAAAAEPPVTVGEPVIVTATRFEDRYLDKPVNATVITAEDIRQSTAKTVPDLLSEQAGIAVHDFFGNNAAATTVDLRGFGVTGTQNTLILLDGRRVSDNDLSGVQWSAIPLAAIERIEIVRGSGAVQYGDGATTGVINIITKSPARIGNLAVMQGRAGTYDTLEGQLYANTFAANFGFNLIGSAFRSDGYRENNDNRQGNVQAELHFLTERGDASFKIGHDDQDIRLPGARTVQPSAGVNQLETDRRGTSTPLDYAERTGNRATLDWRHETGTGQFHLGLGYRDKEQKSYFDRGDPLSNDYRIADLDVWSVSPRMRLPQPVAGLPNTLVAGLDWYHWDYSLRLSNSQANIAQPFNTVDATQENAARYLYNTTQLTPRLTLVAGARGERYKIRASDFFDPAAPPASGFGSGAASGSQKETEYAYELALRYQWTGDWAAIGRVGRSYRFANVDEIYEFGALSREFQFLQPQTAVSYEVGLERRTRTGALRATLFNIEVEDEIHLDVFSTGIGNTNLPPSRRRGLELEARQALGNALRLTGSYSYTAAKFLEGVLPGSPPFTQANIIIAGKTVPLVPRHKLNAGVSWNFAPKTRLDALAGYVGSQYMDNDQGNTGVKIPAYTVADLKLTWEDRGWRFAAAVNNVFDEKYYNYAVRSTDPLTPDRYNAYPLPERSYTMTAEYTFR